MIKKILEMKNFICLFLFFVTTTSNAQLRLPKYFSDYAVIQRDQPVTLWGWSDPGEELSVTIADESFHTITGSDSIWQVQLSAKAAGGPYNITISGFTESITLKDIYFGDVFFCSGQSNMAFLMKNEAYRTTEKIDYPLIRHLNVSRNTAISPQKDVHKAEWIISKNEYVDRLSAVAYYFAKTIHKKEKIPIGIIHSSWGGSPIETFMSAASLAVFPEAKSKVDKISSEFIFTTRRENQALLNANPGIRNPKGFVNVDNRYPTMVYNGMIAPFFAYSIKGILWYQGEANTLLPQCYDYEAMLMNLISSWRLAWQDEEIPFFVVQLASYGEIIDTPESSGWAIVQEAQFNVSRKMKNVGIAIINDIGNPKDIHPRNKRDVGFRVASLASQIIYGDTTRVVQGPILKEATLKGDTFELSFENVGGGLMAKGGGKKLHAFALAGNDNKFYRASAEIKSDKVVVSSANVPDPVYIRYAFESSPKEINFYNEEGFPAVPFRTDQLKDANKRN